MTTRALRQSWVFLRASFAFALAFTRAPRLLSVLIVLSAAFAAASTASCKPHDAEPRHRERDPGRERDCRDPARPRAYFYPAENRTEYRPDDPHKDGCQLLVADHLFCCPDAPRPTDR